MKRKPKILTAVYGRGYVYEFHFRLTWVTRYREDLFSSPALRDEMEKALLETAENNGIMIERMAVKPSYVSLDISFPPKMSPTNVVKALKGGSAKSFLASHPEFKMNPRLEGHIWSKSYYMTTFGTKDDESLLLYIENECTK